MSGSGFHLRVTALLRVSLVALFCVGFMFAAACNRDPVPTETPAEADPSLPSDPEIVALVNAEFDAFCKTRDCSVYPTGYVTWEQGDQRFYRRIVQRQPDSAWLRGFYYQAFGEDDASVFFDIDNDGVLTRTVRMQNLDWRYGSCCRAIARQFPSSQFASDVKDISTLRMTSLRIVSFGEGEDVSDDFDYFLQRSTFRELSREWGGFRLVGEDRSKDRRVRLYESLEPAFFGQKAQFSCAIQCSFSALLHERYRLKISTGPWLPSLCGQSNIQDCWIGKLNFDDHEYDHVVSEELFLLSQLRDELPKLEKLVLNFTTNPETLASETVDQ